MIKSLALARGFRYSSNGWFIKSYTNTDWHISCDGSKYFIADKYGRQIRTKDDISLVGMFFNA